MAPRSPPPQKRSWPRSSRVENGVMQFDFDELFDEDYLYFYATHLTDEKNDTDTDAIVSSLGLQPGDAVLDAPCGHGRISNRLAARGIEVTGVDVTEVFLDVARQA